MKPRLTLVALAAAAAAAASTAAAAPAPAASAASPPDPQAVARGKAAFEKVGCYQCHGTVGQGGISGATLAPNVRPLPYYLAYVRRPTAQMPPYSAAILGDATLSDIHAYLRSIPAGKPASEIPLLSGR